MQRNGIILGVVVLILIAAAGGYAFLNQSKTPSPSNSTEKSQEGGVFTTIKDAISKSVSLKCDFTEDGTRTVAYIKNGQVRADSMGESQEVTTGMIFKDKKFYVWEPVKKTGFMMDVSDEDIKGMDEKIKDEDGQPSSYEDMLKSMEAYKEKCSPSVISDSVFSPPSDVKFTNMSEMINSMPSGQGSTVPSIDPKKMEELMKQYSNQ